ncbi:MAG TPA: nodulation protein NfeD [Chryseosolibacter sp.]
MKSMCLFFMLLIPFLSPGQRVVSIHIEGTINPASAAFIRRSIEKASDQKAECVIIHLNTPGGLLKSTRVIVGDILESPVPVIVYVSPGGAHAGSAGVFITLAAHIAAMAPGTNIGAAHPVGMQSTLDTTMNEKATNDAAAFIRAIADKRNRNGQWAEEAVRRSISITEKEAIEKNVINLIAQDTEELMKLIDEKSIETSSGTKILHTRGATLELSEMGAFEKFLDMISDPNIAYILLLLGLYGVLFELYNPGAILPGIVGVICLTMAFYSMHTLPINYAGLALIVFAIILFLLEIKVVSHGLLTVGGLISLLLGSMMLYRTDGAIEMKRISSSVIISSVVISTLFFLFVLGAGLRAQRLKPVTGVEGMIGEIGESLETLDPSGPVRVHGEIWKAQSLSGTINKSARIRVAGIENLTLLVKNAES